MAASAFFFALMAALLKLLVPEAHPQVVVFWRGVGMTLIFGAEAWRRGVDLRGNNRRALLLRGVVGYIALSCYFASVQQLRLGDAVLLQYSNPLFVALLAPLFMREKTDALHWLLVLVAFGGLTLVVGAEGSLDTGVALGLSGSLCSGIAYMSVRQLAKTDHPLTIMFWFPAISVIGPALLCTAQGVPLLPQTGHEFLGYAAVMLAGLIGQIVLTLGLARVAAARATAVTMAGPVFGLLFGWMMFAQVPTALTAIGAAIVLAALITLGLKKQREAPL